MASVILLIRKGTVKRDRLITTGQVRPLELFAPWNGYLSGRELPALQPWEPVCDGVVLSYHTPVTDRGAPMVIERMYVSDVTCESLEMVMAAALLNPDLTACTLHSRGTKLRHTRAAVAAANRLFHANPLPRDNGPVIVFGESGGGLDIAVPDGYTRILHNVRIVRTGPAEIVRVSEIRRADFRTFFVNR